MGLYFSWRFMLINLAKQAKDTKKKHITYIFYRTMLYYIYLQTVNECAIPVLFENGC